MAAMKALGNAFVRTSVARRIVLLFVLCAIVPVASLSLISHVSVSDRLRERAGERLYRSSKAAGLALMQRLQSLEWDLRRVSVQLALAEMTGRWEFPETETRFSSIGVAGPGGAVLSGTPELAVAQADHIRSGKAALFVEPGPRGFPRTLMAMLPDTADPTIVVWAEIDPNLLWGPPLTPTALPAPELCILRGASEALFCPPRTTPRILSAIGAGQDSDNTFEWESADERWLAASWPLFMRHYFGGPDWKIISSEPHDTVLAPLKGFIRTCMLILVASIVLVALLSLAMIRRNLDPLADLHAATERIAERRFDVHVNVKSNDEFRALADSFNAMASGLGRRFRAMDGMLGLGRDLLSARDEETIVRATLERAMTVVPCQAAAILLRPDERGRTEPSSWFTVGGPVESAGPWDASALDGLFGGRNSHALPALGPSSRVLPDAFTAVGAPTHLLYPIRSGNEVVGALAYALSGELTSADALYARQLSDNVSVALSGASLLIELNDLSWGALRALARAIDAKSSWTAGHSDRVTALSGALGRTLGIDGVQLDRLERGGLLHDIGKIGVTSRVLDKEGPLTLEEWNEIRSHTTLGGQILEPITRFADIIPIVVHHHERWDGGGYPTHLAGTDIPYLARLLALADVYDALTSDRPYRKRMSPEKAIRVIEAGLGTQFDPEIGRVFIEMMRAGEPEEYLRSVPFVITRLMAAAAGG